MKNLTCCLLLLLTLAVPMSRANAADNAVVLLYHHVSESTPPSTSVTPAVFEQHMAYLSEGFRVISLEQAVEALRNKKSLPERAVVITFDDGFSNIYHNAHPILRRYKMPYTVFVNPPLIGTSQAQLTWEQMREMESSGARFANHTSHHQHLLQRLEGETEKGWLTRTEQDILQAEQLLQEKLGYSLRYVAYPYGEFNGAIQRWIAENGFVGFGQHSGALYSGSDFTALPRFPAAGIYANLKTLKIKINSLALPVMYPSAAAISPLYPVLSHRTAL